MIYLSIYLFVHRHIMVSVPVPSALHALSHLVPKIHSMSQTTHYYTHLFETGFLLSRAKNQILGERDLPGSAEPRQGENSEASKSKILGSTPSQGWATGMTLMVNVSLNSAL